MKGPEPQDFYNKFNVMNDIDTVLVMKMYQIPLMKKYVLNQQVIMKQFK